MDRSPPHASGVVVLYDSQPQGVLCEKVPELIAEEPVGTTSPTNCNVIPKDCNHGRTEGNDLNFAVLRVPENDLFTSQVYILDLNVSYCSRPTTTVQKKVNNAPVSILTRITVGFWLF